MRTRPLATGLLVTFVAGSCALSPGSAEPRYGVCRQQILDYVQQRLAQTPTRIEIQDYSERTPPISMFDAGNALVYVKECSGFHSFEIRGTEDLCEHIPHYGTSSGSYIRYEGAFEGCKTG
jgi:hypothetical protein